MGNSNSLSAIVREAEKYPVEIIQEKYDTPAIPYSSSLVKCYPVVQLPKDEEGYVLSFSLDQSDQYKAFFQEYGFVVVNNVISHQQIEDTIDEIWTELESGIFTRDPSNIKRNDPRTWVDEYWPSAIRRLGLLGGDISSGRRAWENRQNENVYKVFRTLMNKNNLWVSVDRYGMMRPTRSVPQIELPPQRIRTSVEIDSNVNKAKEEKESDHITFADFPDWKSQASWAHWDLNPWLWTRKEEGVPYKFSNFICENNGSKNTGDLKLQGLITLVNSREEDGGFCTVPSFHKHLEEWSEATKDTDYARGNKTLTLVNVPKADPITDQLQKISSRAGSLIIWRGEQPHCNYPNDSNRFRINQYLKMFPAQEGGVGTSDRKRKVKENLPKDFQISELGRKLFGLNDWPVDK